MTGHLLTAAALTLVLATLWPRSGLLARWREGLRLAVRVRQKDALKHILKNEVNKTTPSIDSLAGVLGIRRGAVADLLLDMEQHGLVSYDEGRLQLTPNGRELALHVEDEPRAIFAQLSAQGLRPGMKVCVIEKSPQGLRFWADGCEQANLIRIATVQEAAA